MDSTTLIPFRLRSAKVACYSNTRKLGTANAHSLLLHQRALATDTEGAELGKWCCNVPVGHVDDRWCFPRLPAGKEVQWVLGALQVFKLVDVFLQQQCNPIISKCIGSRCRPAMVPQFHTCVKLYVQEFVTAQQAVNVGRHPGMPASASPVWCLAVVLCRVPGCNHSRL